MSVWRFDLSVGRGLTAMPFTSIAGDGLLVEEVRKRKCLWDNTCPDYKLARLKKQMWEEVAVETGRSGR